MASMVVGVFDSERLALAAVRALGRAGLGRDRLSLVSCDSIDSGELSTRTRILRGSLLEGRDEGLIRPMLWGALWGSLVVEVPVLFWLLFVVDAATAEQWGMTLGGLQLFLGSTAWKLGAVVGGFTGAAAHMGDGVGPDAIRGYEASLAEGKLVLAAHVRAFGGRNARGILIESGALELRDVKGTFQVLGPSVPSSAGMTAPGDDVR